jgi:hypothetical protein
MNYLGIHLAPNLLEESWRELERERELQRTIRARRAARREEQRAGRPSRFATFAARLRHPLRPVPRPLLEGC